MGLSSAARRVGFLVVGGSLSFFLVLPQGALAQTSAAATVPSGTVQSGAVPSGTVPKGTVRPGTSPSGTTPKAAAVRQRAQRPMFGAQPVHKVTQDKTGGRALPDDPVAAIKALDALPPVVLPLASFVGNHTAIIASAANGLEMARQTDCSITAANVPYTGDPTDPYSTPADSVTPHYDQLLHSEAGLTTTGGVFAGGCADPVIGVGSSSLIYAGISTGGMRMAAAAVYSGSTGANALDTFVIQHNGTFVSETTQPIPSNVNQPFGVVAGDLNGDGNPDLIAIGSGSSQSAVTVLLGNADGTFTVGQSYSFGTAGAQTAVLDDFNGDGKLDIVIPVGSSGLTFLPGNGDGTFGAPVSVPSATQLAELTLVSGDFNGDGKKDLASGSGQVFLGNGDGTFTAVSTPVFTNLNTNTVEGAQLATGDFNKDGKLDLAAGDGTAIHIYLGNGDGTFTTGSVYSSIDNHGHVMATDLDGDGNLDIYSGTAQGGTFAGDDITNNEGYALMGRGDGTFSGAPEVTYAQFNGLQDLNGDGKLDFVGVSYGGLANAIGSFATYYGNGDGTFHQAAASLPANGFTYLGTEYQVTNVDSYTTGDINGDGHPDLIYLPGAYFDGGAPRQNGFVTALANPDGSFQTPQFQPIPSPDSNPADELSNVTGLQGLVNQNGKFEILYSYTFTSQNASTGVINYTAGYATQVSNGDGTFAVPILTATSTSTDPNATENAPLPPLSTADLNGDKIPDVLMYTFGVYTIDSNGNSTLTTPPSLQEMLGNADGSFAAPVNLTIVTNPQDSGTFGQTLAVGDLNGDGIPDIVIQGESNPDSNGDFNLLLGIGLGKGDGTFQALTPLIMGGFAVNPSFVIADFTGDGKADLAVTGTYTFQGPDANGIFIGNGDGTFQSLPDGFTDGGVIPALSLALQGGGGASGAYDINNDGKIDLVAGNTFYLQPAASASLNTSATALTASASSITAGQGLTLTATVTAASGSGTPTGTVTFYDGTTSLGSSALNSSGVATVSTTTLAVGAHTLTAAYGGDSNFAASTSMVVTVMVTTVPVAPAASTTTLTASATAITTGQSVTLTAAIAGPSGNTVVPTGSVTFVNGTTTLGIGTLSGGVATLAATTLPAGSDPITAVYGGDANFAASTSTAVTVTVTAPVTPDFALSLSPSSATVSSGGSTTTTVSVQPAGGFIQAVTFSCSGLPAGGSCSFSPASLTPSGTSAVTTTLTIATTTSSARTIPAESRGGRGETAIAWAAVLLGLGGLGRRRRQWGAALRALQVFVLAAGLAGLAGLSGCGSSGHKNQTSTITVTAAAGSTAHTAVFTLTVK